MAIVPTPLTTLGGITGTPNTQSAHKQNFQKLAQVKGENGIAINKNGNVAALLAAAGGVALDANGNLVNAAINATPTTVNGATSGTLRWTQPYAVANDHRVKMYLTNLKGAASVNFLVAFSQVPAVVNSSTPAATVTALSASGGTFTGVSTGTGSTGYIILDGD